MSELKPCSDCEGRGVVDAGEEEILCGTCQGTGRHHVKPCFVREIYIQNTEDTMLGTGEHHDRA